MRATGEPLAGVGVAELDAEPATRAAAWWLRELGASSGGDVALGSAPARGGPAGAVVVEVGGPPGTDDWELWGRAGLAALTRYVDSGEPAFPAGRQSSVLAGTAAAIGALAALWARAAGGAAPARLALDRLEVAALMPMQPLAAAQLEPDAPPLISFYPGGVLATRGGPVYARPVEPEQWRRLLARVPGLEDVAERLAAGDAAVLAERREAIDAALAGWLATQEREPLVAELQADHVPFVAVLRPDELPDDPHLAARGFFADGAPGVPWLARLGPPGEARAWARPAGTGPLAGLRVLDLSWAWAGPFATTLLADLGADVVNVEWQPRLSNLRCQRPFAREPGPPNSSGWWSANQRGKRSVGINFKDADGVRLVHELAAVSDVVLENFSPGVVDRLGIGFDDLVAVNPRLVYVSMSAFGKAGPHAHFVGYGTQILAASGGGFAAGALSQMEIPYPDPVSGFAGALGALAYAVGAARDGRPAFLDLSELECMCALLAAAGDEPARPAQVRRPAEVLDDPWLAERGYFVPDEAAELRGSGVRIGGPLFAVDGVRLPARAGAPTLFAHTREVLAGALGRDDARIDALYRSGSVA